MSLVYRAVFNVPVPAADPGLAQSLFADWLQTKYPEFPVPGKLSLPAGDVEVRVVQATRDSVQAFRGSLRENTEAEHWTTTATVMTDGASAWMWVDVERVATDIYSYKPLLGAPRLVVAAFERIVCTSGSERLTATPQQIGRPDVNALVERLLDPNRQLPIVVVTEGHSELRNVAIDRATRVARASAGLTFVVVASPAAAIDLESRLGHALAVYGGAIRTYFPGIDLEDPRPWRHPYILHNRLITSRTPRRTS